MPPDDPGAAVLADHDGLAPPGVAIPVSDAPMLARGLLSLSSGDEAVDVVGIGDPVPVAGAGDVDGPDLQGAMTGPRGTSGPMAPVASPPMAGAVDLTASPPAGPLPPAVEAAGISEAAVASSSLPPAAMMAMAHPPAAAAPQRHTGDESLSVAVMGPAPPSPLVPPPVAVPALPPPALPPAQQVATAIVTATDDWVELCLTPEHLGRVRLRAVADGDILRLTILSDRPETLELLRRTLPDLAATLPLDGFAGADLLFDQAPADADPDPNPDLAPPEGAPPPHAAAPPPGLAWPLTAAGTLDLRL